MSRARIIACIFTTLSGLFFLYESFWFAWLTAAGMPERVHEYRIWCYICLAAVVLCYVIYTIVLRPKRLLLYLFNTMVVVLWFISLGCAADSDVMKGALVVSTLYLLWRGMEAVRCRERDR